MSADGSPLRIDTQTRTCAQALVDQLAIQGVTHVFCVPGESYLGVLDALYDHKIEVIVCRQEGGAAIMAEAYAKATGKPGVCMVTRGPGATNAAAGIHIAHQDSTPVIMFVGQVEQAVRDREAFQELDYRSVFGSMTKWTAELSEPTRVVEYVTRAFHTAANGRPGPVVIALPKNVLTEKVQLADAPARAPIEAAPGAEDMVALESLLHKAQRPMVVLGGSRWDEASRAAAHRFAERFDLPVTTSYRRAPLFDALDARYAGDLGLAANPKLIARIKSSDLVIVVGCRLDEITAQGYGLFDAPGEVVHGPRPKFVHVHPGVEELGRVFMPDLAINASPKRFTDALNQLTPPAKIIWSGHTAQAHADYVAWSQAPLPQPGEVNLGSVMIWLRDALPDNAVIANGSGNFAAWIHRFFRFRKLGSHLASTSASMGYGVPAAVAMQAIDRSRTVVSINGDGDFLMNGQEFATAVQYDLPIIVLVFDNGVYGTIRMHQEREYPGRVSATALKNPDFAAYARAFGGFGATVERTEDFPSAFRAAQASKLPSIIHVKFDPEGIAPGKTISDIRETSLRSR